MSALAKPILDILKGLYEHDDANYYEPSARLYLPVAMQRRLVDADPRGRPRLTDEGRILYRSSLHNK